MTTTRGALFVALLAAAVLAAPTAALFMIATREPPSEPVGRYQLLQTQYGFYLVDTTTGEVWRRDTEGLWSPIAQSVWFSNVSRDARAMARLADAEKKRTEVPGENPYDPAVKELPATPTR